jgi:signal transduction histidine kinase
MSPAPPDDGEQRVIALAPSGRDGALLSKTLATAGIATHPCADEAELMRALDGPVGAVLVTEEALSRALVEKVRLLLADQPPWSDLPIIVLISKRDSVPEGRRASALLALGNVTILERPLSADSLISAVSSALRSRRRQYQSRALLARVEREVRRRDQFLAMLGHELRNPLGAIRNASELVHRAPTADDRLRKALAVIQRQTRHLTRIVDDLLEVARVSAGKVTLQRAPLELGPLLETIVNQAIPAAAQHELTLTFRNDAPPVVVQGDPVRLDQVFTNLVTNAIKYTPPGGRIDVVASFDGAEARVTVADTGLGIAADMLPQVFDLFLQVEGSLERSQGGLGIGLTLVQNLVRLHGGRVEASSAGLGRGAAFTVSLPAEPLVRAPETAPAAPAPSAAGPARHVLIVEDSRDNRESLQELLVELGHKVDVAADGRQGLERVLSLRPDVALVDLGLPEMDGYEVARRVRAQMGDAVYLVALSGYGQPEDRQRSRSAGFDAHVTKPADIDELQRLIERRSA